MATVNKNLSSYDINTVPDSSGMKFGIVVSEWNENITKGLLQGAFNTLIKHGTKEENVKVYFVPGAYELPLGAQTLFEKTKVDAVICLGSVIQGETKHFDFVCQGAALGIKDVALKYNKPAIFGVLTDNNEQQAIDRSGGKHGNKGDEAAITAIKMIDFQQKI